VLRGQDPLGISHPFAPRHLAKHLGGRVAARFGVDVPPDALVTNDIPEAEEMKYIAASVLAQ
jgi:hypothetical protein